MAIPAAGGVVLAAAYILRLLREIIWGAPLGRDPWPDLSFREGLILVPLAILVLWLGLYPATFLAPLGEPVQQLLHGASVAALQGGLP